MNQLIFATNNANKLAEIQAAFGAEIGIKSLKQAGIETDIEEPFETLEENALQKCRVIHGLTNQNCFGEDTGLFVPALNNEPGVKSARYAGEQRSDADNISLLLSRLSGHANRSAYFKTVVALTWNETEYLFEGICPGKIIAEQSGSNGFGYDPVFVPDGRSKTFAEMTMAEKALFSHRKKAMQKLVHFLKKQQIIDN